MSQPEPLRYAAEALRPLGCHLFFSHDARFLDPLVPEDWSRLRGAPPASDATVLRVASEWVAANLPPRAGCIFFPAPIARGLAAGTADGELAQRFRYDMIRIDADQRWTWRDQPVAERTRRFLLEHVSWQPAVARYAFEYRVNAGWWDRSYFEAVVTPWRASALEPAGEPNVEPPRLVLQDGRRAVLGPGFRLDDRERLFARLADGGEALLSETLRYQLLRGMSEDLSWLTVGGIHYPVLADPDVPPAASAS
jgi:hypothetical protein